MIDTTKKSNKPKKAGNGLGKRCSLLEERTAKLEKLLTILSRGKYIWESSFDAIAAPVLIVSGDYHIDKANLNAASVAKMEVTELIGKVCYEVFAKRDKPCENCPVQLALDKGTVGADICCAQKNYFAHAYMIGVVNPPLVVVTYQDVTEERRLHNEVIQQEKMAAIGMLAGGVAHEINNPLGGILAFTQLLKQGAKDEQVVSDLGEIENAALRCKRIISDLLDFSRSSKEGQKRLVNANELLERVFPFIKREMKSYNVELEFKPSKTISYVYAHPDRLQQVFLNLMTNACHAMPKGGRLLVETCQDGKEVFIVIRDEGSGMSKEVCDRVFEPFFTTKDAGKGTGLGLSISYRIIKDHGGRIEVDSEEGKGTTFNVYLPVSEV